MATRFDEDVDGFSHSEEDPINPAHYKGAPVEAIEVIRHIRDARLANAMKYIWRISFGGKENDRDDAAKAIWYLNDYLDHPVP